jgi:hypothetical protein
MESRERARRHVRRRYEIARLGEGLAGAWPVAIVLPLAVVIHGHVGALMLVTAIGLAVAAAALGWRGGAWQRGVVAGFVAGLPTLVVPAIVLAVSTSHAGVQCAGCEVASTTRMICIASCLASALAVGIAVGLRASRDTSPPRFAAAAVTIAALTGLLGCSATGLGGAAGVIGGLVLGGVPTMLLAPRPSA